MLWVERREDGREGEGLGFGVRGGMEENELEEGEACSGQEDYPSNLDPDALTYIDEKIQDVLGHFQKDFEGLVSAENLGAKFGSYGSFLPTYQRSPLISSQTKSPSKFTTDSASRSPRNLSSEDAHHNPSVVKGSSIFRNSTSALDSSGKKDIRVSKLSNRESIRQCDSLNRPVNGSEQNTLKVRIRVGPDKNLARNNAAIYSGLGLDVSPSSSVEKSPDRSGGLSPELGDIANESPQTILQVMACFSVPGGFLLSPLRGNVLQLTEKVMPLLRKCKTNMVYNNTMDHFEGCDSTFPVKDVKAQTTKKMKPDEKKGRSVDAKNSNCIDDISTILSKDIDIETQAGQDLVSDALNIPLLSGSSTIDKEIGPLAEQSAKGVKRMLDHSKEMKNTTVNGGTSSPESVKYKLEFMECTERNRIGNLGNRDTHRKEKLNSKAIKTERALEEQHTDDYVDSPFDLQRENKGIIEKNYDATKAYSDEYKGQKDQTVGSADHMKHISSCKAVSSERDEEKIVQGNDQLFQERQKQPRSQLDVAPSVSSKDNLVVQSSRAIKERKKNSHSSANQSEKKIKDKLQKGAKSDFFKESRVDVKSDAVESGSGLLDLLQLKDKQKDVKPENENEPVNFRETIKERPGSKKMNEHPVSKAFVNEPVAMPSTSNGTTTVTVAAIPAPIVIKEHWVCCDICQKWRLLPYEANPDHLPKKWQCGLLNWLPGMNSCDISEEETTKALNALYMAPAPEIGINSDGRHDVAALSMTAANVLHLNQGVEQNVQCMTTIGKRKSGPKDETNVPNHLSITQASNSLKKKQQAASRNLNDVNNHHLEPSSYSKAASEHGNKPMDFTVEKHKSRQKEKHKNQRCYQDGGDFMERSSKHSKSKSKRMVNQDDCRTSKKIKKELSQNPVKNGHSDFDLAGKTVPNTLSSSPMSKTLQKYSDVSLDKEKYDTKGNQSALPKRLKDDHQFFSNGEKKDYASISDVERSDNQDFSSKKRKLKQWQESCLNTEAQTSSQQETDNLIIANEPLSEADVLKVKKLREPNFDGKVSKEEGRLEKTHENRTNFPSNRGHATYVVDEDDRLCQGNPPSQQALNCRDSLKEDTIYAQTFAGATSSSSKISGSRKSKANIQQTRVSPVGSVSSSPQGISNIEKLYTKKKSVKKDETFNNGFSSLESPKRCLDNEVDGEPAFVPQQQSLVNHREGESGTQDWKLDYQEKKPSRLSVGKVYDDKHLKMSSHDDLSPSEAEEIEVVTGSRNLISRCARENPDKNHAGDLDKLHNNHQINGLCHLKPGKCSSTSKDKQRIYKFDIDNGKDNVSVTVDKNIVPHLVENGDRYPRETNTYHFEDCDYHGEPGAECCDTRQNVEHDSLEKQDLTLKCSGVGRRDILLSSGIQGRLDARGPPTHFKQHKGFDSRAASTEVKCGGSNTHEDLKPVPSFQAEKSSHILPDRNGRSELTSGTDKSQRTGKQEMVCSPVRGSRLEEHSTNVVSKVPKQSRKPDIPNATPHNSLRQATPNRSDIPSPIRKDGQSAAYTVLKEARDLKHTANRLKSEGHELESTGLYFEAALKFLHVASLWEPVSFDSSKQGDTAQSIQMYSETAKLCEFCAHEYERCKEMAAAALAYKCVEVAYLKAAYYKYPTATKDRHELQIALQMVPPGESPSSSASDVDNLNNQNTASKAVSAKDSNSPQVAGNHLVAARNHPYLMRLLAYTNDLNCAFEATRKSQVTIAAAGANLEKDGVDGINSVRKVLDFNFHNVKGLLRLVRLSMESIT
ncbi:cysteine-tryptophan domain-containing zinc finger protein 7-like [Typha latifolia]|uniref:cysteine-tryptophan domain-containing zinc finger protein 7-like n=1 Tax=Typha latifolia TaxID=4733 RepID=UPI003C2BE13D